jgi:hypothetical protein
MATERLSMRKTREILRHKWLLGRGYREVARSVDVSLGAVWLAVQRATEAGLDWPAVEGMDDAVLEARVYAREAMGRGGLSPPVAGAKAPPSRRSSGHQVDRCQRPPQTGAPRPAPGYLRAPAPGRAR